MPTEIKAWVVFCFRKVLIGISIFFNIAVDCKTVDNPPKLIIKVAHMTAYMPLKFTEISWQPFVISINP